MSKQQFNHGDLVMIAKDLGSSMSHFTADKRAIVIGSYKDQFGSSSQYNEYTLYIEGEGEVSWYYERQLTLIERNQLGLLEQWKTEREADRKVKSDLDWVFSHGEEVLKEGWPASIGALAACLGITDLWCGSGEGWVYYENSIAVLGYAAPWLKIGDKDGWLKACQEWKETQQLKKPIAQP